MTGAGQGRIVVDRTSASLDPRATSDSFAFADPADGELRGFFDGSVLELFTSSGRAATARVYPTSPPPWSVAADDDTALRLWPLRPAVRDAVAGR